MRVTARLSYGLGALVDLTGSFDGDAVKGGRLASVAADLAPYARGHD